MAVKKKKKKPAKPKSRRPKRARAKAVKREPKPDTKAVRRVFLTLEKAYPDSSTELTYESPFQLLVAVILSAQCTDARVNQTTPALFARFPTPQALAKAEFVELAEIIHSCGFYQSKAKSLLSMSRSLLDEFGGEVPKTLDELVLLRGVGRKTASVVLNQAFGLPAIAVDTHVSRVSQRIGWAHATDPVKIEFELRELLPKAKWASINGTLILHGRRVCKARKPLCSECQIRSDCRFGRRSQD